MKMISDMIVHMGCSIYGHWRSKRQGKLRESALLLLSSSLVVGMLTTLGYGSRVAASTSIHVVAAENTWGSILAQLGGRRVLATSLIDNVNIDPHLYVTDARDAAAVARASLIIENGASYDTFMARLISTGGVAGRRIIDIQRLLGFNGAEVNPHFWYDLPRIDGVAKSITNALESIDPGSRSYFQARLSSFYSSMTPVLKEVKLLKTRFAGAKVAYTERLPGYLLQATALVNETPSGFARSIEDGSEPSPHDTELMQHLITNGTLRLLLYNTQTVSPTTTAIKLLARQHHIPIVGISEMMPPKFHSFPSWQLSQLRSIEKALQS